MIELEEAERLALEDVVAVPTERDLLVVRGVDAASYLHGQLSQTVEGLAVGSTVWTLLLQPQGKVDAWLRMHRRAEDEFWLDTEVGYGQQAKERLERFKLRVDAEITLAVVPMLALRGPRAVAATMAALEAGDQAGVSDTGASGTGASGTGVSNTAVGEPPVVLDASWASIAGVDLVDQRSVDQRSVDQRSVDQRFVDQRSVDQGSVDAELGETGPRVVVDGVEIGPPETLEVLRIRQGRPAMGSELDESTIPAAAGVVDLSVDFTKGCYVGQELVARVDSRGNNTPTRLYGLRFTGEAAPVGSELSLDGAAAGTVTSAAVSPAHGPIGLAYLKRSVEVPASLTAVSAAGTELAVEAIPLPEAAGSAD